MLIHKFLEGKPYSRYHGSKTTTKKSMALAHHGTFFVTGFLMMSLFCCEAVTKLPSHHIGQKNSDVAGEAAMVDTDTDRKRRTLGLDEEVKLLDVGLSDRDESKNDKFHLNYHFDENRILQTSTCALGKVKLDVGVTFDNTNEFTSWEITDSDGNLIEEKNFKVSATTPTRKLLVLDVDGSTTHSDTVCLDCGKNTFTIYNSTAISSYTLTTNNNAAGTYTGGTTNFGSSQSVIMSCISTVTIDDATTTTTVPATTTTTVAATTTTTDAATTTTTDAATTTATDAATTTTTDAATTTATDAATTTATDAATTTTTDAATTTTTTDAATTTTTDAATTTTTDAATTTTTTDAATTTTTDAATTTTTDAATTTTTTDAATTTTDAATTTTTDAATTTTTDAATTTMTDAATTTTTDAATTTATDAATTTTTDAATTTTTDAATTTTTDAATTTTTDAATTTTTDAATTTTTDAATTTTTDAATTTTTTDAATTTTTTDAATTTTTDAATTTTTDAATTTMTADAATTTTDAATTTTTTATTATTTTTTTTTANSIESTTSGTVYISEDICSLSQEAINVIVAALTATLVAECVKGGGNCDVTITEFCGRPVTGPYLRRNRSLTSSRRLAASEISYQLSFQVQCISDCSGEQASISSTFQTFGSNVIQSVGSDTFLTALGNTLATSGFNDLSNLFACAVAWVAVDPIVVLVNNEDVTSGSSSSTGAYYPDWESGSDTCKNDDSVPLYMKLFPSMWLYESLEACCDRYFSGWNKPKCMGEKATGLWFVDNTLEKCVNDCEGGAVGGICGGQAPISDQLFEDPAVCCETKLPWKYSEFCTADSLGKVKADGCYPGSLKYYRGTEVDGHDVCVKDCDPKVSGNTCGGIVTETWVTLYESSTACCAAEFNWIDNELCARRSDGMFSEKFWPDYSSNRCAKDSETPTEDLDVPMFNTAEACCSAKFNWIAAQTCVAASTGVSVAPQGSNEFFVDWNLEKCVQNCVGSAPCRGLAEQWDTKYTSSSACCASLPWIEKEDCVFT